MRTTDIKEQSDKTNGLQVPTPNPALKRLDVLVGTWDIKGRVSGPEGEVSGEAIFKWLPGKFFLEQRFSMNFLGQKVEGVEIIGYDPSTKAFVSSVYSNLGAAPPYRWDVVNNVVTHSTEGASYKGTLSSDGKKLTGRWEPEKGKETSANVAYDTTMTRIDEE